VPAKPSSGVSLISAVTAPDAQTLVLRYRQTYAEANVSGPIELIAVPRHLMADLYQSNKPAFLNSPYWTSEFVGLGPYRVGDWVGGSHVEALAFDDYVLGRPKIDRLIIRYFSDVKGLVASLLANDVDVSPVGSMKAEEAVTLKQQWETAGAGSVISVLTGLRYGTPQYRDPNAPWVRDVRTRQALVHMTDRQAIVDTLMYGMTTVADTPIRPDDPTYRALEQRGLARYPYDLTRAERLMNEAGWRRGPDGTYLNDAGEPYAITVASPARTAINVQEVLTVADEWKQAGLAATPNNIPYNAANLNELKATVPGVFFGNNPLVPGSYYIAYTTPQLSSERNRWLGSNKGGYSNPVFDRLYQEFSTALDPAKREATIVEMAKLGADEAVWIPLYYDFDTAAIRKGVDGIGNVPPIQVASTWNAHAWDVR
jgi:peptide/nickel transport system substrate-binding protein